MRVLIITSEFHPRIGGIERYVDDMAVALCSNAEVALITGEGQHVPSGRGFRSCGALNLAYPKDRSEWLQTQKDLIRLAREYQADVIHLANAGLAVYAKVLGDIAPVFATVHCKDFTRPWQLVPDTDAATSIRDGLSHCRLAISVSQYTAAKVRASVSNVPVTVLTPGLSQRLLTIAENLRLPHAARSDRLHVVTVGKLVRRKGHVLLLDILKQLPHTVRWTIIGDGPCASEIISAIANSPLANQVEMMGAVDDPTMWRLVASADLFALTPVEIHDDRGVDAEGFGLVFVEAAALGIPSIASIYGGCRDAVPPGCGMLVDPYKPLESAFAICDFLQTQVNSFADRLRRQKIARERYRWSDRSQNLLAAYREATNCFRAGVS